MWVGESGKVCLSDANLHRYVISPVKFSQVLNSDEQVNTYALFIGSLGDQADRWVWVWNPQWVWGRGWWGGEKERRCLLSALSNVCRCWIYSLFIGSLVNQADRWEYIYNIFHKKMYTNIISLSLCRLVRKLPAGKGFVCMDLKEIPQILQQIFTSTFLSSSSWWLPL